MTRGRVLIATVLVAVCLPLRAGAAEPVADAGALPRIPPTEPNRALATFRIKPGFRLELTAAEPLVVDPIALSFDEDGRLFVVEMRDYSERRPERLGRIRRLEDPDGDGRFDRSTVYVENLPWPTAVFCHGSGVFVGSTPDLFYFRDADGDGVAEVREVIFTGFASDAAPYETNRLNVQALLNSFNWGLDNRIHGATSLAGGKVSRVDTPFTRAWRERAGLKPPITDRQAPPVDLRGRDFSFDPRTLELRAESGGAQHGLSFDSQGRKFVCSNSDHLQLVMYEDRYASRSAHYSLPPPRVSIAADGPAAEVFRLSPDEPWRVLRTKWRVAGLVSGPIEGGGRPSGYFTGATGATIYRGDAYPDEYRENAFIADCGSNLVHRKRLDPDEDGVGLVGRRPVSERGTEFLASTDNWFRPVQFANAPDGCLHVADMYREVIEHPWSLPDGIKRHLDLNRGNDRGRLYRIVPEGFQPRPAPRLGRAATAELVKTLEHPNGWHRDTAARLLYERQDRSAAPMLARLASKSKSAHARMHALYALDGLAALEPRHLMRAMSDPADLVREHAVRLTERFGPRPFSTSPTEERSVASGPAFGGNLSLARKRDSLADDLSPRVHYQLAFTLAEARRPEATAALAQLILTERRSEWVIRAALSSVRSDAFDLVERLLRERSAALGPLQWRFLNGLGEILGRSGDRASLESALDTAARLDDPARSVELAAAIARGVEHAGSRLNEVTRGDRWHMLSANAARLATNVGSGTAEGRLHAVELLGLSGSEGAGTLLLSLVSAAQPEPVQLAAIGALMKLPESGGTKSLLDQWNTLTPRVRTELLNALLARPGRTKLLFAAIAGGVVPRTALSAAQVQGLRAHREPAIRSQAVEMFGAPMSAGRDEVLQSFLPAVGLRGDPANGKRIYLERCASCHRVSGQGHPLGPDLNTVKSAGKEKLLVGIIDPSREVAPSFLSYTVETKSGDTYSGLIASETEAGITLRGPNSVEIVVARSQVARLEGSGRSMMPEELEAGLTTAELGDLLEYLAVAE